MATKSAFIIAAIEACKNRDVTSMETPNAFIQTSIGDKSISMKLRGVMCNLLLSVAPEIWKKYFAMETRQQVFHIELSKALHSLLKSTLKFHLKLVKDLKHLGFKLNKYDGCIANRYIDGKQQMVTWHVDDLKLLHVDKRVNNKAIAKLRKIHENTEDSKMKVVRGKIHKFLGMIFNYSKKDEIHQ